MKKSYLSAPLPFQGQKRNFAKEFIKALEQYSDKAVFGDLFGGSGLLSHIVKTHRPDATVVYNDFDNYRERLRHIPDTNRLLCDLRVLLVDQPRNKKVCPKVQQVVIQRIEEEERNVGYVDYITLSANILFAMKYCTSLEELKKETLYNTVRKSDYLLAENYLDGIEVVMMDYKDVFAQYKDEPSVVFLIDPPYLSTDTETYDMYWKLADYLDVLTILSGHSFVYFTSNKSSILELCEWMGRNKELGDPFSGAVKREFNARMNYNSSYTDIMLCKRASAA